MKKYQPQVVTINKPKSIYVNFNHNNFVTLEIENLDNLPKPEYLKNKIVILGFSDPSNPDSLAMLSPLGNMIPAIELQAHQIANLLTDSYFSLFPLPLQVIIIISGVIILNYLMIFLVLNNNYSYLQKIFLCLSLIIILFVAITFISYSFKFIISYSVIFLTWLLTCISILISLKFSSQRILLQEQEYELMRLRSSEQEAILAQAKKLINRLASDLHDGPLQELKVVMDDLEILEMQHDHLQLNSSLDKLEKLGIDIRKILAKKDRLSLNITPELKKGLAHGIRHKLEELKKSQKLTLQIVADLENLQEPSLSSLWLANREDIFLFFCEAMNNVIKHAQPPFGSATYVKVNLRQEQEQCVLEIINDGSMANNHHKSRKHGGYGTKLMQTVASELPSANWQRYVDENEVYVSLCWILST